MILTMDKFDCIDEFIRPGIECTCGSWAVNGWCSYCECKIKSTCILIEYPEEVIA